LDNKIVVVQHSMPFAKHVHTVPASRSNSGLMAGKSERIRIRNL